MASLDTSSSTLDKEKFIYDKVYDELNRCRDWPIKIMAFTSALYFSLIGFIQVGINNFELTLLLKIIFSVIITIFWLLTIYIIIKQHYNYIDYRNIQIRLQNKMGIHEWQIDNKYIFPKYWRNEKDKSIYVGIQGWFFYAFYLTAIYLITVSVLLNK